GIWTTRTLARSRDRAATVIGTGLGVRARASWPFALAVVAAAFGVEPGETRASILLLGAAALASAFVDHFGAVFRGYERFSDEGRLFAARGLLIAAAGLGGLALGRSLVAVVVGVT